MLDVRLLSIPKLQNWLLMNRRILSCLLIYKEYFWWHSKSPTFISGVMLSNGSLQKKKIQTNDTFRTIGASSWECVRILCFFVLWLNLTNLFRFEMLSTIVFLIWLQSYLTKSCHINHSITASWNTEFKKEILFSLF